MREFHDSCFIGIRDNDPEILQARVQLFCTFTYLLPSNFEWPQYPCETVWHVDIIRHAWSRNKLSVSYGRILDTIAMASIQQTPCTYLISIKP